MPPVGGARTAELRHKSGNAHRRSRLLRGVGRVVPTCAVLQVDRASAQVYITQTPRPPTMAARRKQDENLRLGNSFRPFKNQFRFPEWEKGSQMNQKQYRSLEELPLMMNMTDVAAVLGISRAGAYKLAHSADFPAFQIGRRIVVSREKFVDWLNRQCEEQKCA